MHEVARGPGWGDSQGRDALDDMISGVQNGLESESEEEDGNPNAFGDRFKCGQAHDGTVEEGPNARLAARLNQMHDIYSGSKFKNDFQLKSYRTG